MDRNKRWADLSETEKAALHPDIKEIMKRFPDARLYGSQRQCL